MSTTKIVKKSELKDVQGHLAIGDEVVTVEPAIISQANELEDALQHAVWEYQAADKHEPAKEVKPFKRIHSNKQSITVMAPTPTLDERAAKSKKIMDEIDATAICEAVNADLAKYVDLVTFADSDEVVVYDGSLVTDRFDTPVLGDPLSLSVDRIVEAASFINSVRCGRFDLALVHCVCGSEKPDSVKDWMDTIMEEMESGDVTEAEAHAESDGESE